MYQIIQGLLASFFFSITFLLNRSMELDGGSWLWSSSLRFLLMAPILIIIIIQQRKLRETIAHLYQNLPSYLLWSSIGFGLFYAPLTFSAAYYPSWLVAGAWQLTIISGSILLPFISNHSTPWKQLRWSLLIIIGVFLMLIRQCEKISSMDLICGLVPILLATFMYPLGNRKMMDLCNGKINTIQRVTNMTLASLPFWLLISSVAYYHDGMPSNNQLMQSLCVAIFSGVIATLLFFSATQRVHNNPNKLAAVEATQSGELPFSLLGDIIIFKSSMPDNTTIAGIILVVSGMILHSFKGIK